MEDTEPKEPVVRRRNSVVIPNVDVPHNVNYKA